MKKYILPVLTVLSLLLLVSCGPAKIDNHTVVISKLYGSTSMDDNAIELYNNSDEVVNLKGYTIDIYGNASTTVTSSIKLKGKISENGYFALSSKNFNGDHINKIDLVNKDNLSFNGDDAITLSYKGEIIDSIGTIGSDIFYSKGLTLTRLGLKKDFKPEPTFNRFNFIQYLPDDFKFLKNDDYKIKTLDDLLKGPELSFSYMNMPYDNGRFGTGGAPVATLQGVADGDTATFGFPGKPAGGSHRYYYINTPEVAGPNTEDEAWGAVASKFNKEFILNDTNNKEIRIQSVPEATLTDTYGRNLGLIWVDGKLSQFEIVAEGLSLVFASSFDRHDMALHYENVPYLTFLLFAEQRAKENGWGVHGYPINSAGEKSPDWDYETKTRTPESSYKDWTPHLKTK